MMPQISASAAMVSTEFFTQSEEFLPEVLQRAELRIHRGELPIEKRQHMPTRLYSTLL
jgi:hypothetical protein